MNRKLLALATCAVSVMTLTAWIAPMDEGPSARSASAERGSAVAPAVDADAAARPNIVVILTDDQAPSLLPGMKAVNELIADRGVTFTDTHTTTPTCCPSRASLLSGHLAQSTGVWTNWLPYGGWEVFHDGGWDDSTVAVALDDAGYHTGLVGKYMNGYASPDARERATGNRDYVPPGWDTWHAFGKPDDNIAGKDQGYFDYWLMSRDQPSAETTYRLKGSTAADYSTDVLTKRAVKFINEAPTEDPLFLYYAVFAPHKPYTPAPRHAKARVSVPTAPPGLNDAVGKPNWIKNSAHITQSRANLLIKQQARTLLSVDEGVEDIINALKRSGRLNNTLIVYASDNGLVLGQFRLLGVKNYPYASPIPMLMRWDQAPKGTPMAKRGSSDTRLSALIDITKTVETAAGIPEASDLPGLSLLDPKAKRTRLTVSAWRNRGDALSRVMSAYCATRTKKYLFARYQGGFEELYDLSKDPWLLTNVAKRDSYRTTLNTLRKQTRTDCSPTPPDFSWTIPTSE